MINICIREIYNHCFFYQTKNSSHDLFTLQNAASYFYCNITHRWLSAVSFQQKYSQEQMSLGSRLLVYGTGS